MYVYTITYRYVMDQYEHIEVHTHLHTHIRTYEHTILTAVLRASDINC